MCTRTGLKKILLYIVSIWAAAMGLLLGGACHRLNIDQPGEALFYSTDAFHAQIQSRQSQCERQPHKVWVRHVCEDSRREQCHTYQTYHLLSNRCVWDRSRY